MKIKNLAFLVTKNLITVIKRFPMSVLFSVSSTALTISRSYIEKPESIKVLDKLMLCSFMGMFLFTLLQLVSERFGFDRIKRFLLYSAGLVLIILYGVFLPEYLQGCDAMRYFIIIFAYFILIFIVQFTGAGEERSLNFQRNLWHSGTWLIYAIVISGTLFLGIALAYAMVVALFEINNFNLLVHAFTICGIFVAPMVFSNGLPLNEESLNIKEPEGFIRMIVDYVFIPLSMVYIIILAVYFGKTIFTRSLPEGEIAYLVITCSSLGILIYYLVHRFDSGMQKGIERVFTKIFFWCMIPMVALLWRAIVIRLSEYGVTENRYIILMLAAWLSGVTIHGLIIKKKNFKTWPSILAAMLILSIFGPWSMFSISRSSQYSRMMEVLNRYGAVKNGKFFKSASLLSPDDSARLSSSIDYLLSNHEGDLVISLVPDELRTGELAKNDGDDTWKMSVKNSLEKNFNLRSATESVADINIQISQNNGHPEPVKLNGFSYLITVDWQSTKKVNAGIYTVEKDMDNKFLNITKGDKENISIDLTEYISTLRGKCGSRHSVNLSSKDMTFSGIKKTLKYKIIFNEISFSSNKNSIHSVKLYLLVN